MENSDMASPRAQEATIMVRKLARGILIALLVALLIPSGIVAMAMLTWKNDTPTASKASGLSTRVIISVDQPLGKEGGAIIVSGRPIPVDEWRAIEAGGGDNSRKEFNLRVSSPASIVDFVYPQSGTYSFKLKRVSSDNATPLTTRQIRIGSAEVHDPETDDPVTWPSMSVIHVEGDRYDAGWARIFASTFDGAFRQEDKDALSIQRFAAGRVLSLSQSAIEAVVQDSK
ncbi:Secreted protein (modular protein) [Agrobacterium fabacearum TT111]|nr:Secreted protein (modular protein) [Agrobacterium fabacearum TT111]